MKTIRHTPGADKDRNPYMLILALGFSIAAAVLAGASLKDHWHHNLAAIDALIELDTNSPQRMQAAAERLSTQPTRDCRAAWLLSRLYQELGMQAERDERFKQAMRCSAGYISFVEAQAPERLDLAEYAVSQHPEYAPGWLWLGGLKKQADPQNAALAFWRVIQLNPTHRFAWRYLGEALANLDTPAALRLYEQLGLEALWQSEQAWSVEAQFVFAKVIGRDQPQRAIALYRQALQVNPHNGFRWLELGLLLRDLDPQAAIEAFLQACYNGDPGSNGCYLAGRTAEELGDFEDAIRYYRLSRWSGALERADQLEKELAPNHTP